MYMVAVYVHVLINHIRHIAEAHPFHILAGEFGVFHIAQTVVGMRIEGDMHHRPLRARGGWHPASEILIGTVDVSLSRAIVVDLVCGKQPAVLLVDFLPVVAERTIQRVT